MDQPKTQQEKLRRMIDLENEILQLEKRVRTLRARMIPSPSLQTRLDFSKKIKLR